MIAFALDIDVNEIDGSFWRNVFTTSGVMPHYLSYALETIKRNNLTVKLDNGLIQVERKALAVRERQWKSDRFHDKRGAPV